MNPHRSCLLCAKTVIHNTTQPDTCMASQIDALTPVCIAHRLMAQQTQHGFVQVHEFELTRLPDRTRRASPAIANCAAGTSSSCVPAAGCATWAQPHQTPAVLAKSSQTS